jgi:solute carrier family 24 (sodium/potassium/calcium exchanger), member 6
MKGFPAMAIGSIVGSPMLTTLFALGVAFTFNVKQFEYGCVDVVPDAIVLLTFFFLLLSLGSSIIMFPVLKFSPGKIYGLYLISLYVIFIILAGVFTVFPQISNIFIIKLGGC